MFYPERILDESFNNYGIGTILYDISDINKNFGYISQTYDIDNTDYYNNFTYYNMFDIYDKHYNISNYTKHVDKEILWDIIFDIKKYFIDKFNPAIIDHFIKEQYTFKSRLDRYKRNLENDEYTVISYKTNIITVIRRDVKF